MNSQTYSIYNQIYDISRLAVQGPLSHRRMGVYEMQYICCRVSRQSLTLDTDTKPAGATAVASCTHGIRLFRRCTPGSVCRIRLWRTLFVLLPLQAPPASSVAAPLRLQLRQQVPSPLRSVTAPSHASSPFRSVASFVARPSPLRRPQLAINRKQEVPAGSTHCLFCQHQYMLIVVLHQWLHRHTPISCEWLRNLQKTRRGVVSMMYTSDENNSIYSRRKYSRWKNTRGKYTRNPKP